jgi:hypothetical protein
MYWLNASALIMILLSQNGDELKLTAGGQNELIKPIIEELCLDRQTMGRYLSEIAWETEVWVAQTPTHLIHFNGGRFLGPY